jgi:hypothetical protein
MKTRLHLMSALPPAFALLADLALAADPDAGLKGCCGLRKGR